MENGRTVGVPTIDASLTKIIDKKKQAGSYNEIMARRLKNRERQRRYRARKRLEADTKDVRVVKQPISPQEEMQANSSSHGIVNRIHCKRDWKKDARMAHLHKEQEIKSKDLISDSALASESQAPSLPSDLKADPPLIGGVAPNSSPISDASEIQRVKLSRRHWKAEARNKNS